MSLNAPIEYVLFDLDDTLIDWHGFDGNWQQMEKMHLQRVYDYLKEMGRPLGTSLDHFTNTYRDNVVEGWSQSRTTLRAPNMEIIMLNTLAQFGFMEREDCNIRTCLEQYGWQGAPKVKTFEDVHRVLPQLIEQGYTIGILTNAFQPMWVRDAELERFDLMQYFPNEKHRMSAADLGYLKPHPKVFERALKRLGGKPSNTVYIGDNPIADITGAQGAGLRAIHRKVREMRPIQEGLVHPDATLETFDELIPILDEWNSEIPS